MSENSSETTELEIFDTVYHVRGSEDDEYLQELASLVDGQMRDVASKVTTADPGRLAILVALNLADELSRCRKALGGEREEVDAKVVALTKELQAALKK